MNAATGVMRALLLLVALASGWGGAVKVPVKVPYEKIQHPTDDVVNRLQGNVERAINRLGATTMDHWSDGTLFRRPLGVNLNNLLTASGIAPATITAASVASGTLLGKNIALATISGANLAPFTVGMANLAPANQFSVYRQAAFNCGPGYSPMIGDSVVKDVAAGYNTTNGVYTIPASGDWQFNWACGFNSLANAGKEEFSALVINSGSPVLGNVGWSAGTSQYFASVGSFLYCNAVVGEKIQVRIYNGDTVPAPMAVTSGTNYFNGFQVR